MKKKAYQHSKLDEKNKSGRTAKRKSAPSEKDEHVLLEAVEPLGSVGNHAGVRANGSNPRKQMPKGLARKSAKSTAIKSGSFFHRRKNSSVSSKLLISGINARAKKISVRALTDGRGENGISLRVWYCRVLSFFKNGCHEILRAFGNAVSLMVKCTIKICVVVPGRVMGIFHGKKTLKRPGLKAGNDSLTFSFASLAEPQMISPFAANAMSETNLAVKQVQRVTVRADEEAQAIPYVEYFPHSRTNFILVLLMASSPFFVFVAMQKVTYHAEYVERLAHASFSDIANAQSAFERLDFASVKADFRALHTRFSSAREDMSRMNIVSKSLLAMPPLKNIARFMELGERVSSAAVRMSDSLALVTEAVDGEAPSILTEDIERIFDDANMALMEIREAKKIGESISSFLIPSRYEAIFSSARSMISEMEDSLSEIVENKNALRKILGMDQKQRYMFVFQNNAEMRPTGGFMGSFAVVDVSNGSIESMEIPGGGFYDYSGSLVKKYDAPDALSTINKQWQMQDANWYPDWPTTAKKIEWFFENSGGSSLDGVFALNTFVLEDLLNVVGSVKVTDFGKEMNAGDFRLVLQEATEFEYDKKENAPKKIIASLTMELLSKIMNDKQNMLKSVQVIEKHLSQKNILLFFKDRDLQKIASIAGFGGEIKSTEGDYVSVIHTNIGGGKTDQATHQSIDVQTSFTQAGEAMHTIAITRKHEGVDASNPFMDGPNISYMRVYTPLGSKFVSANGFTKRMVEREENALLDPFFSDTESFVGVDEKSGTKITEQFGKTVFENWIVVLPGEERTVMVSYVSPNRVVFDERRENPYKEALFSSFGYRDESLASYRMYFQKQSGMWYDDIRFSMKIPDAYDLAWSNMSDDGGAVSLASDTSEDRIMGAIFRKK